MVLVSSLEVLLLLNIGGEFGFLSQILNLYYIWKCAIFRLNIGWTFTFTQASPACGDIFFEKKVEHTKRGAECF